MKNGAFMDKILDLYISEQFQYEKDSLDFSCSTIEISIQKDEMIQGSFQVTCSNEPQTEGYIYASNSRMKYQPMKLTGKTTEVFYEFNSRGMEVGDTQRGNIYLVTNQGEKRLPFTVKIYPIVINSSIGKIENLFHFTNLAKMNWQEAVGLFYEKEIITIFVGNDKQYFSVFKGLAYERGNQQNVDTFLVAINKKQPIEYLIEEDEITIQRGVGVSEERLVVTKKGWGYCNIECSYQGDFLFIPKEELGYDDFLGNRCELAYYIDNNKLHSGVNYGKIILSHGKKERVEITIMVTSNSDNNKAKESIQEKKNMLELTNYYVAFRTKKISTNNWINNSMSVVEKLVRQNDENYVARLFQIQLLITKERYSEAKWLLGRVDLLLKQSKPSEEILCYFWYLSTLHKREDDFADQVTLKIEAIFQRNSSNWKIGWILLYLNEEYRKDIKKRWDLLERLFKEGCASPIIFLEAVQLINTDPTLLTQMSGFGLRTLLFAQKNQPLKKAILPQILYLLTKIKKYDESLCTFLRKYYKSHANNELLQGICSLLILGNKVGEGDFAWYQLGIQEEIRIIRLYEYYMMSIPLSYKGELPKSVMMYFAYRNTLKSEKAAFLFANIIKNRDSFPEMVMTYRKNIIDFIKQQLKKGSINKDLAYLYSKCVQVFSIEEEVAKGLKSCIFQKGVTPLIDDIKYVVVIHEKMKGEVKYPVTNGKAIISIYTQDFKIFLQKENGDRYLTDYVVEDYLLASKMMKLIKPFTDSFLGYDLFFCEISGNSQFISRGNVEYYERLAEEAQLSNDFKKTIVKDLIHYYDEMEQLKQLDDILLSLNPQGYNQNERAMLVKYFIQRGIYDKASEWVQEYGVEGIGIKSLFILSSCLLLRDDENENAYLLDWVYYCFSNRKYDERLLKYLIKYYQGEIKKLREIWSAAISFNVDTYQLSERILIQMLFSNTIVIEKDKIYQSYSKQGAKRKLRKAYLIKMSHEYFLNDNGINIFNIKEIEEMYYDKEDIGTICYLALLKYYSENVADITVKNIPMMNNLVEDFMRRKIYFSFFTQFNEIVPALAREKDYVLIEYRGNPKSQVVIHYKQDDTDSHQYLKEEMKHIYGGIYGKKYLLFYGENLQYYITENINGGEEVTESGTLTRSDDGIETHKEDKFSLLNDIVMSESMQDYDTLDKLVMDYKKHEYMSQEFFTLL